MSGFLAAVTWRCDVCGARRPDAAVSVHKRPLPGMLGEAGMTENVKFCNDRRLCAEGVRVTSNLGLKG